MHARRRVSWALLAALAATAAPPLAWAKGAKPAPAKPKQPEWSEEAGRQVLQVFDPPLKAYLMAPPTLPEAGKKAELVIVLHGHGGTATGMLGYVTQITEPRNAFAMACEGSGTVKTDQGEGHSWSEADVAGVLECLDAALAKHPIDPARVVLMGHSAGGHMTFSTHAARPKAFAGIYTTAAPASPTGANKGARAVVNLGTKDPNFVDFAPSVAAAEKTVVGRVVAVEDLAHDLPNATYSQEAIAWLFDSKSPSETLRVPLEPATEMAAPAGTPAAKAKGTAKYRHVLKFVAGGRGAPADAPPKATVKATVAALVAECKKAGKTEIGDRVAADSQDPLTKDLRGVVTGAVVARYGGPLLEAMGKLAPGDVIGPIETDAGFHLVARDP